MKIYNSLTDKKEEFKTLKEGKVNMYVCGPTVYNYIHIGNARPVVFFDIVKRYLVYKGYEVTYASNITDVDDKIINRAIEEKVTEKEIVDKFATQYFVDCANLGSNKPDVIPYATNYINQMVNYIKNLEDTGYAYYNDGNVYFRISKIDDYGILSNQRKEDLIAGARIDVEDKKESPLDFTLWKNTDVGIKWDSPWGKGRPGWHTECCVMIDDIFKGEIDIHGGGTDLKFPHHENEIAQANASGHNHLSKYWMHVGRLQIDNQKMSKSEGRTIWVKDLIQNYPYQAFRLFILSSHYRQPINYTDEIINQYNKEWEKISKAYKQAYVSLVMDDKLSKEYSEDIKEFETYMDDDFNTPNVLMLINNVIKKINTKVRSKEDFSADFNTLDVILNTLGIIPNKPEIDNEAKEVYKNWNNARINKDFEAADKYRNILIEKGII
jgi:cysteinyl-tRNA synthetase